MTVVELQNDAFIAFILEQDRIWSAYALADLDEPYRDHARFIGLPDSAAQGLVLFFALDRFTAIVPCGAASDVDRVLALARDIPRTVFLNVRDCDLPAVEQRYKVLGRWQMLRMLVEAEDLVPIPAASAEVVGLGIEDADEIRALYTSYGDAVFEPSMLAAGFYQGVRDGGMLVGVAGTHTVSHRFGIATIGGVFTRPDYRGRGIGTAVTAAVGHALRHAGMTTLALNVREDNAPAIAAYRRLGFRTHMPFWEGHAELRG